MRKDEWTPREVELMTSMFAFGFCDNDIAIAVKKSISAVRNKRNSANMLRKANPRWSKARLRDELVIFG